MAGAARVCSKSHRQSQLWDPSQDHEAFAMKPIYHRHVVSGISYIQLRTKSSSLKKDAKVFLNLPRTITQNLDSSGNRMWRNGITQPYGEDDSADRCPQGVEPPSPTPPRPHHTPTTQGHGSSPVLVVFTFCII